MEKIPERTGDDTSPWQWHQNHFLGQAVAPRVDPRALTPGAGICRAPLIKSRRHKMFQQGNKMVFVIKNRYFILSVLTKSLYIVESLSKCSYSFTWKFHIILSRWCFVVTFTCLPFGKCKRNSRWHWHLCDTTKGRFQNLCLLGTLKQKKKWNVAYSHFWEGRLTKKAH